MFLFERMFGIATYMLILFLVCFLLTKTNISCKSALRFYTVCLCVMAFFYKPYKTADLYRIFEQMEYLSSINFNLFWREFVLESSSPISRLLFWFFGKSGCNELLPVFSALFCYSLIFYIINKTKKLYDISNRTVAVVLFFIMTTSMYISVIGGIRMMIALSMITFSYFRATIEKKIKILDIIFFVVSIFTHAMSFVVFGIIALSLLLDSEKNALKKMGYVISIGLIGSIFFIKFSGTVHGLYEKFLEYVLGDKYSDPWEYLMGAVIIISLIAVFFEFNPILRSGKCSEVNKYNISAVFCIIFAICFCFEFSMFYRFGGHLAVMFSIPSIMISIEKKQNCPSIIFKRTNLKTLLILLSCIISVISCTRGSLCSLKFFEL